MSKYFIKKKFRRINKETYKGYIEINSENQLRINLKFVENMHYKQATKELFKNLLNVFKDYNYIIINENSNKKSGYSNAYHNIILRKGK